MFIKRLALALAFGITPAVVLATAITGNDDPSSTWDKTADGRFYIVPLGDTGKVQYRKVGAVRKRNTQLPAGSGDPVTPAAPGSAGQCVPASEVASAQAAPAPAVQPVADNGPDPSWAKTPDGKFYIVPLGDTGKVQYRKVGAVRVKRASQAPSLPQAGPGLPVCTPEATAAAAPKPSQGEGGEDSSDAGSSDAGTSGSPEGSDNPFLADDLLPSFSSGSSGEEGGQEGGQDSGQGGGPSFTISALTPPAAVPEPGSLALLGLGLLGLGAARRRRP